MSFHNSEAKRVKESETKIEKVTAKATTSRNNASISQREASPQKMQAPSSEDNVFHSAMDVVFTEYTWEEISGNKNSCDSSIQTASSPPSSPLSTTSIAKRISKKRLSTSPAVRVTAGSFLFGQQLGEGAYGRVVHAKRKDTDEEYAVKVMEKNFIKREKKVSFVMQEKNILSKLSHRNIVKLYFTFKDVESLYMVMDLCYGELLHYIVHRTNERNEKGINDIALSLKEAHFYIAEIVEGLEYLHKHHIVHRDLKPENILLDYNGHVKIADFGTALDETKDADCVIFCGTAQYVSPEVLEDRPANKGCDLWALGCIVFQVCLLFAKLFVLLELYYL
jgi:3-phosphoinositide dependent protein kinase-1